MKRFFAIIALLTAAISANAGRIVTDSLYSNILKASVKYNVYLPDGFNESGKTYPVVYLLHGLHGDYTDWAKRASAKAIADELIGTGEAVEMVIIMPNAGGDKGHRAVMGLSMGGGGSTVYSQRHPELFSSGYAMSAWLDYEDGHVKGNDGEKDKLYYVCKSVRDYSALDFIDNADEKTLEALRSVAWFIDCGDDDFLVELSFRLHMKMKAAKVKSELRIRNGVHNWEYWHGSLRLALPFASRNFEK